MQKKNVRMVTVQESESSDEFELVSNTEEAVLEEQSPEEPPQEPTAQQEVGAKHQDDFDIEEDDPVEKAKMIKCLKNIKEQIKDAKWEVTERARAAERTKAAEEQARAEAILRRKKDHCLKESVKKH